jgi:hypothetical protein
MDITASTETETETETFPIHLWDIAGVNGLQIMKSLVGEAIDRIAPLQSLETQISGQDCSVLRLCEGNFRISCCGESDFISQALNAAPSQHVWVKQFDWLGSLLLPETAFSQLLPAAIPKPPYRLENLPLHCAAPARIDGISVLVWRHTIDGKAVLELHAAQRDLPQLRAKFHPV